MGALRPFGLMGPSLFNILPARLGPAYHRKGYLAKRADCFGHDVSLLGICYRHEGRQRLPILTESYCGLSDGQLRWRSSPLWDGHSFLNPIRIRFLR